MKENVFSHPWMSRSAEGHAFWRSTRIPSRAGSVQARTLGIPSICIRQFGHEPVMHDSPRGRWYLNDRPVIVDAPRRQRRSHRVPFERGDRPALEPEPDRPIAPDRFALTRRETLAHAGVASLSSSPRGRACGRYVRRISFVVVCRSARNHARQPL